ncbi:unnamed protein product [Musa acuminata subsp. burmannicoides]
MALRLLLTNTLDCGAPEEATLPNVSLMDLLRELKHTLLSPSFKNKTKTFRDRPPKVIMSALTARSPNRRNASLSSSNKSGRSSQQTEAFMYSLSSSSPPPPPPPPPPQGKHADALHRIPRRLHSLQRGLRWFRRRRAPFSSDPSDDPPPCPATTPCPSAGG